MNPQVAQTPEGIADGEASSSEVKTYPTGKGHKGISTSRKKPSAFNTDQQQIGELKKNIRAYVRANGSQQELKLLQKALTEIEAFHADQQRRSGQPVIIHPLRVAWQICEVGLDPATVIAALLHDAVEDTPMTLGHINKKYGPWYSQIVEGVTKVKHEGENATPLRSELEATYQRMLMALAKDVRVLFIKMFDRLDNMRDMQHMPVVKKRRISQETLNVYVPMARRLGLKEICQEHTELCFQLLYPKRYKQTIKDFENLKKDRLPAIQKMREKLENGLQHGFVGFQEAEAILIHPSTKVFDPSPVDRILERFQILVKDSLSCYQTLGLLHTNFSAVPLRIRDYISNPLWNGYQGIQTELNLEGERIEIEIISKLMKESNRNGILSHWNERTSELEDYYRTYLEQLDQIADAEELRMVDVLNYAQTEQLQVFSPKGDVYALPKGATVLDFAYYIHTDLGNHCIGAMVNPSWETRNNTNLRVPRERQLFHGECLKILMDPGVRPSREWIDQTVTAKSHVQIRRAINLQNASRARRLGRDILGKELEEFGERLEEWLNKEEVQKTFSKENLNEKKFLQELGLRKRLIRPFLKKYRLVDFDKIGRLRQLMQGRPWYLFGTQHPRYLIENPEDPLLRMAVCCQPIPGDKIVAFVNREMEIEIHRHLCEIFSERRNEQAANDNMLEVEWNLEKKEEKKHTLNIQAQDGKGILLKIIKIISAADVAIENTDSHSLPGNLASIKISLEPVNWQKFHRIMEGLRPLKFITRIS